MSNAEATVLLLGGSRYYIRGIESARKAGFRVIVADRNKDAEARHVADIFECVDIVDVEGIVAIVRKHEADCIVPLNDYGVLTAAHASQLLGLPGITPEVAEDASNKERMRNVWARAGVPCPRFEVVEDLAACEAAIARVGLPCILKPAHGIGGASRGVIVVRESAQIGEALAFCRSFYEDKTVLIEQFVDSELEHSAEVLIHDGQPIVLSVSDKIKSPLPYRVDKNVLYPTRQTGSVRQELERTIREAVRAIGITIGAAHVELASTKEGFVLFELGARCGGGGTPDPIIPHVTGINQLLETIRIHLGLAPDLTTRHADRGCNYHFLFAEPGRLKEIRGLERARAMPGILDAAVLLKPGDLVSEVRTGIDRAGFLIAAGADAEEALQRGRDAEAAIEFVYD